MKDSSLDGGQACSDVLVSIWQTSDEPHWLRAVGKALSSAGLCVLRAQFGDETIRRVEGGGLAAAVVVADQVRSDGISLLRIIRSIDVRLPCWLVVPRTTRQVLEAALALQVTSVMTHPVEVDELALGLTRVLGRGADPSWRV